MSLVTQVTALTQRVASALLDLLLPSVDVTTPGVLAANKMNQCSAAGTYTAPTPNATVGTFPMRWAMTNRYAKPVYVQFPNPAGVMVTIQMLAGATTIWRQVNTVGFITESGKPQARMDERYRTDLEAWDRALDHAPGSSVGEFLFTGQPWVPAGYTTTSNDPTAYPKYIGTGSAARLTTDINGSPLGVFAQVQLAGAVNYMQARFTINPNTTNGGGTAGTVDTGTLGLIMWEPGFNGNGSAPNVYSPCHLSFNATGFTYGCIYNPGNNTPTFAPLVTKTYAKPLEQDGTTVHSCAVVIDPTAPNDAGGRGLAYVYAPDGVVYRISNNAIGAVPTATVAAFEIYKASSSARLAEFVDMGADSRRGERILEAKRNVGLPRYGAYGITTSQAVYCPRIHTMVAQTSMTSGQARFHDFEVGDSGLVVTSLAVSLGTAQAGGTGTLVKVAIYADRGDGGGPMLSSAGLLAQATIAATTAGTRSTALATALRLGRGRYWTCYFYYAGTVAPTTAPLALANGGSTGIPTASGGLGVYRYLTAGTGLTDLPVGNQGITPVTDAQGPVVFVVSA